jgi:apolipoprotein N-acyltransferase
MPSLLRLAPITGVYGLSFVLAMLGCAFAAVALRRPRRELAWLLLIAPVFALPALPAATPGTESVRVVQPNIDTEAEWTPESLRALEQQLEIFSRSQTGPLLVWPEAPAPFYPADRTFREYLTDVARSTHAYLLMGGVGLDPDGQLLDRYEKIKLVPFGEFVPPPFGWVNRITKEAGDFAPGNRIVIFQANGHRLGAFICYESAFPDLVRQFARDGAEVLINLSNDGYFGHSAAYAQHLEIVRMRAAENRRWILRATNDGITAAIDPAGRVTERLPPYTELAATMHLSYIQPTTPYTRHGDWFAWSSLVIGLAAMML